MVELLGLAAAAYWVYKKVNGPAVMGNDGTYDAERFVRHCYYEGKKKLPNLSFEAIYAWAVYSRGDERLQVSDMRTINERQVRAESTYGFNARTMEEQLGDLCAVLIIRNVPVWSAMRCLSARQELGEEYVCSAAEREQGFRRMARILKDWYGEEVSGANYEDDDTEESYADSRWHRSDNTQLERAYELLGVTPQSSPEEIRSAWRHKVAMWHPDKLDGMAEELKAMATDQMKRFNEAYELLHGR